MIFVHNVMSGANDECVYSLQLATLHKWSGKLLQRSAALSIPATEPMAPPGNSSLAITIPETLLGNSSPMFYVPSSRKVDADD